MNQIFRMGHVSMLSLVASALCSCATSPITASMDPIGPNTGRASQAGSGLGFLEVFSATEPRESGGIVYHPHSSYSVYSTNGVRVAGVVNRIGDLDQKPTVIELPAGYYLVHAQSDRFGLLRVPVVISAGRLTSVHLDGPGMTAASNVPESEYVRLPDGRIAGRRADQQGDR